MFTCKLNTNCMASLLQEDNVMLRYVNDKTRQIYAFEMVPAPPSAQGNVEQQVKEGTAMIVDSKQQ